MGPTAYIQDRWTDYPYKGWKIRCIDNDKAILDVQGRRTTLVFEIGPGYVKLIERDDPELAHLVGKEFVPGKLLMELSKCGLHMMPDDQDAYYAGVQTKSRETEERGIIDIATSLNAFSFRSSKWNRNVEPNNIIVKIRENLEFDREFFEDYD